MTTLDVKLGKEINEAIKEKNEAKKIALRSIKSEFDILKSSGKEVTESDQIKVIQKLVKQRNESAKVFSENSRQELADKEIFEMNIIQTYLPTQLSQIEVEEVINQTIQEMNIEFLTDRDFGKVVGFVSKKLSGKTDGKTIADIVKSKINKPA